MSDDTFAEKGYRYIAEHRGFNHEDVVLLGKILDLLHDESVGSYLAVKQSDGSRSLVHYRANLRSGLSLEELDLVVSERQLNGQRTDSTYVFGNLREGEPGRQYSIEFTC